MREYIYIDNEQVNSFLAQINKGLATNKTVTHGVSKSQTTASNPSTNGKLTAGVKLPFVAKADGEIALRYSFKNGKSIENDDQESVNTVMSDYSVELIEKNVSVNNFKKAKIGDLVQISEKAKLLNFDSIYDSTEPNIMKKIMNISDQDSLNEINQKYVINKDLTSERKKELRKEKEDERKKVLNSSKETLKAMKSINLLGEYGKKIFPRTIIIKGQNYIAFSKSENYRMNKGQLDMISNSSRTFHILGIVENQFNDNGLNINDAEVAELGSSVANSILYNFNILKDGAFIIKPLAIYFKIN